MIVIVIPLRSIKLDESSKKFIFFYCEFLNNWRRQGGELILLVFTILQLKLAPPWQKSFQYMKGQAEQG